MRKSILLLGDVIILYGALVFTLIIRYPTELFRINLNSHLLPFTAVFVIWLVIFYIANLYELSIVKNNLQFYSTFFTAMVVNFAVAVGFFYLIPFVDITPRRNLFIYMLLFLGMGLLWRWVYNQLLAFSGYRNNTLIVGLNNQSQELYDYLLASPQLGYNAIGILDIKDAAAAGILAKIVAQKNVKTLVLGTEVYQIPHIVDIIFNLVPLKIRFYNLSAFSERVTGKIPLDAIDQTWFIANLSESEKRVFELAKRSFDLALASLLSLCVLPFVPLIALAIRWDSKGPIFYTQMRVGRGGKEFKVLKFRSLIPDAEGTTGAVWPSESDARSTRIGKILRKTRIDELPQLVNILKGEMSFVGPRPERPEFHDKLKKEISFYEERHLVLPGLTGWAQIKYKLDFRGGLTVRDTMEKVQYDLFYIKNRSILLDIGILLKTLNILLRKLFA